MPEHKITESSANKYRYKNGDVVGMKIVDGKAVFFINGLPVEKEGGKDALR